MCKVSRKKTTQQSTLNSIITSQTFDADNTHFWKNLNCADKLPFLCQRSRECREINPDTCGYLDQEACAFDFCFEESLQFNPVTLKCDGCGGFDEEPCDETGCNDDFVVSNTTGLCQHCGTVGNLPCSSGAGIDGCIDDTVLDNGICVECGGLGQPNCKQRIRWFVEKNICEKKCCFCETDRPCYEWNKVDGEFLVGNECAGNFRFTYRGNFPSSNLEQRFEASCASNGDGPENAQTCPVTPVTELAEFCLDNELVRVNGVCESDGEGCKYQ